MLSLAFLLLIPGCSHYDLRSSIHNNYGADILRPTLDRYDKNLGVGDIHTPDHLSGIGLFSADIWRIDHPSFRCAPPTWYDRHITKKQLKDLVVDIHKNSKEGDFSDKLKFITNNNVKYFENYYFKATNVISLSMSDPVLERIWRRLEANCLSTLRVESRFLGRSPRQVRRLVLGDYTLRYKLIKNLDVSIGLGFKNYLAAEFGIHSRLNESGVEVGAGRFFAIEFVDQYERPGVFDVFH